jgi:competence protein ComFC
MLNQPINKTASFVKSLYQDFKEFLAPSSCLCCGRARDFDDPLLCPICLDNLTRKNSGGGPICPFCRRPESAGTACQYCAEPNHLQLYFWGHYEEELRDCLLQFKFHRAIDLGNRLVDLAVNSFEDGIKLNKYDLVLPVPLYKTREREREYNQSEILAEKVAVLLNIELRADCLTRIKATRQQAKLDDSEKWENVKDAFMVEPDAVQSLRGRSILLVDDIVTTGATIYEAARPLWQAGVKNIDIFSLAYSR